MEQTSVILGVNIGYFGSNTWLFLLHDKFSLGVNARLCFGVKDYYVLLTTIPSEKINRQIRKLVLYI